MKLLVQPESGIEPLLEALRKAKKSIHILIFRIDRSEIEKALVDAVARGVSVKALIAYTNRGGDKNLRRFEMRLLEKGITVARTADDLVRYHGKMFLIDHKELYLLAFNFTHMDINLSRSFAVSTTDEEIVAEAEKLFECDVKRTPYTAGNSQLVVSPVNAREELVKFIQGAKKQLLMYEMKISDRDFIELLTEKISQGVDVRVIGRMAYKGRSLPTRSLPSRLHARVILRDGHSAFLGSQSLRKLELEARREVGIIFHETKLVKEMIDVFDADWKKSEPAISTDSVADMLDVPAKKVAKAVAKQINMRPVVEQLLDKVMEGKGDTPFEPDEVAETVREAFREEVHDAVVHALEDLVAASVQTNGNGHEHANGHEHPNGHGHVPAKAAKKS
ncbi:MAG TPA: phospholipase D-like domain-containing protein [Acidobacteriaceae bacterium]